MNKDGEHLDEWRTDLDNTYDQPKLFLLELAIRLQSSTLCIFRSLSVFGMDLLPAPSCFLINEDLQTNAFFFFKLRIFFHEIRKSYTKRQKGQPWPEGL